MGDRLGHVVRYPFVIYGCCYQLERIDCLLPRIGSRSVSEAPSISPVDPLSAITSLFRTSSPSSTEVSRRMGVQGLVTIFMIDQHIFSEYVGSIITDLRTTRPAPAARIYESVGVLQCPAPGGLLHPPRSVYA